MDNGIAEIDELKMYFGDDYIINDKIKIHQPTIGDIVEFGEKRYYSMVYTLCAIPSDMKSQLEDIGLNYMDVSDFEFFVMSTRMMNKDDTSLLLGDLDLSEMKFGNNPENGEPVLVYVDDNGVIDKNKPIIDKLIYRKMIEYIRKLHGIVPKIERAANETTRQILIKLDREKITASKDKEYKSQLKGLISGMMRYPGFKYKKNELKECGLCEFMESVQGAQIYVSTTALLQGMYSGMIDSKSINSKEFNWLRPINE